MVFTWKTNYKLLSIFASVGIQDSLGFWIPDSGFQVLDSGFFVSGIWIPDCIVVGFLELSFSDPIPLKFSEEVKLGFVQKEI